MKWSGESTLEYWRRVGRWHKWFAWRPVFCDDTSRWVWLEFVMRRSQAGYIGAVTHYKETPCNT